MFSDFFTVKKRMRRNVFAIISFFFVFYNLFAPLELFATGIDGNVIVDDILMDSSPTSITRNATLSMIAGSSATTAGNTTVLSNKETWLDGLAWTAANVIIDQFGDALVTWIQNGFEGSPMFLSDPEGFFRDTANQVSGAIIDEMDLEWLCEPIGPLRIKMDFFFPGTDRAKYRCTFNDIVDNFQNMADRDDISDWLDIDVNIRQNNIVREYGNDFRNGGFLMWLMSTKPKNNDVGRVVQAADNAYAAARVSVEMGGFQLKLNSGFFGVKKCIEEVPNMVTEVEYDPLDPDNPYKKTELQDGMKCAKWETKTPGQLVQSQLNSVVDKDKQRLQVADEIDEIIGTLATTMMGWLVTGGNGEGGLLGYDKDANYSGSNRDHYGELSKNQQLAQEKQSVSNQTGRITEWEENYGRSLEDQSDALYGAKEDLGTILAKLNCIYATSTSDTSYDYSTCDDDIEEIGKNLDSLGKDINDVNNDRTSVQTAITNDIEPRISDYENTYDTQTFEDGETFQSLGLTAVDVSARALEIIDSFVEEVMMATRIGEIKTLKDDDHYCYDYNKRNNKNKNRETGQICGLFGESAASGELDVEMSAENNPVVKNASNGFATTTRIHWKAINAEECSPTGGEKTWRGTTIGTSGSYVTPPFKTDELRTYGIRCYDQDNNRMDKEIILTAAESNAEPASLEILSDDTTVEVNTATNIYWLSSNASSCYLYSDKDNLDEESVYITEADSLEADSGFFVGEGYYRKEKTNSTKKTATGLITSETNYKIICAGNDGEIVSEEMDIDTVESEKKTYQTHSEKEWKEVNKETVKIEEKMDKLVIKYTCALDEYTQDENVDADDCAEANQTSSAP